LPENNVESSLLGRIRSGQARVGTVGLGYVGLPLAVEFAEGGLDVIGFDLARAKVDAVNRGQSYILDVPSPRLAPLLARGRLTATADLDRTAECDAVIICVPTPLSKTKDPDLSMVVEATRAVAARLRPGHVVVL
jgi:UDP-N-acetyl-D-glucosamine dehydrogenase